MKLIDLDEFWNLFYANCNVYQDESLAFDEAMKGVHVYKIPDSVIRGRNKFTGVTEMLNKPEC